MNAGSQGFRHVRRPLVYSQGGTDYTLQGTLRKPTAEELAGGVDVKTRVVQIEAATLDFWQLLPENMDRIVDPSGRAYKVNSWDWVWQGKRKAFARFEVEG